MTQPYQSTIGRRQWYCPNERWSIHGGEKGAVLSLVGGERLIKTLLRERNLASFLYSGVDDEVVDVDVKGPDHWYGRPLGLHRHL
ncbi:uncharacterized protein OCT59_001071 [Rhizophagus irregularis]|uniref:uncharacterized protein n=1 Tax=Rhizophagus irregularis TaxID=588596 RepID=UPI0033189304|nr:hypothetical protein OCT59_001071 [Rhizophagus irregularis]